MPLRTTKPLTEEIVEFLSGIEDAVGRTRSMRNVVYWHEYDHRQLSKRRREALRRERQRVQKALWNLERAEFITMTREINKPGEYRLTPKGWLKFAVKYARALNAYDMPSGSKDVIRRGSYVVIFDIPEEHRRFRDTFRQVLLNLGCTFLQKSIFITESPKVTRFIARIIANCELEDRVKILLVKSIL